VRRVRRMRSEEGRRMGQGRAVMSGWCVVEAVSELARPSNRDGAWGLAQ
jgi:hypothetical protein